ncbi:MAG: DUF1003 domain-containing protein [Spirochaetes bacterium]|nr:DUF1003 domain-containing protein [Spirochaetota bacterium]
MATKLHFPQPFHHQHPPVRNTNDIFEEKRIFSIRASDRFAAVVGSWKFIVIQTIILILWVILNVTAWAYHWDPYPFILMNLVLSLQAAYATPIIMMSQNRLADRDRIEAHNDYLLNVKSEEEVRVILEHLEAQNRALAEIHDAVTSKKSID